MADRRRPPPPPLALRGHAALTDLLGRSTGRRPPVTFASPSRPKPAAAAPDEDGCCPLCGRRVAPAAALAAHAAACADADDVRRACGAGGRQQRLAGNGKKAAEVVDEAPTTAGPPPSPLGPRSFDAACVARRLAHAIDAPAGTDAVLARDRANPADGNAVAVVPYEGATLGYLPRAVAAALAPALDGGGVVGVATLLADARGPAAVPVRVTLTGTAAASVAAAARAAASTADTAPAAAARAALADVVDSALTHDAALWLDAEAAALARLRALPPAAAAFYLTLYRAADTGRWHRPVKWEGGDGVQAAAALVEAGLAAATTTPSDVAAAAAALTAPELRAVLNAPAARKADLVAAAAAAVHDAATRAALVAALACAPAGSTQPPPPHAIAVRLLSTPATALRRAERAYWGDEGASVADAGGAAAAVAAADVPPPRYGVSRPPPLFASRHDLEDYEVALVEAGALDDALSASETDDAAVRAALAPLAAFVLSGAARDAPPPPHLPPFLAHVCAAAIRTAAASVAAAWLERQREWRDASALLRALLGTEHWPRRRGEWWTRLAVNAEHTGSLTTALEITTAALADAAVDGGDRLGLQRRFLRLGRPPRRWGAPPAWAAHASREPRVVTIEAAPTGRAVGVKSRFVLGDANGVEANGATVQQSAPTSSVEGLALHHYATTGNWAGTHGEGGPWARLFGLLLGGVVWGAAPAGALPRPGLWAPLDVGTPAFYAAREGEIDAALAELAACDPPELASRVLTAWRQRCSGSIATTTRTPPTELADVAACAGPANITTIFRLIARAGGVASAFPDLTLWRVTKRNPAGVALAGRLRLVEVKGPRDRLSDGQRVVLAALEDGGVDCEVLKVVEPTRKRKKE